MQHPASGTGPSSLEATASQAALVRALGEDGGVEPSFRGALDVGLSLYRHMLRLRLLSARMVELQRSEAVAFHASSLGEEAVVAAVALVAREHDWVFPGVREWGTAIVRGLSVADYAHHAFGTASDPAKGHAAPDHPPARRQRVAPASGVPYAHLPQAVGAAWAAQIRKDDVAVLAVFGEGADASGDLHNALNFAGVFKAPCVFVCRRDGRGGAALSEIADTAAGYGLASARVDGADPLALVTVLRVALGRASRGLGATLVEAVTKPLAPALAPGAWSTVAALGEDDALVRLRRVLERERLLDAAAHDAMVAEVRAEIDAAVAEAQAAPAPAPSTMFEHVYADVLPHLIAQKESSPWRR